MSKKILIVEDELIAAEYLKSILEDNGLEVVDVIDNGAEAITKALELQPDLVLMDIMLRDNIAGCEAAVEIYNKNKDIAILFLSAYSDDDMLDYALRANSYGYLMKPYNEHEIINTIKIVLAKISKQRRSTAGIDSDIVQIGKDILFDKRVNRLYKNRREVELGAKSLALLELLCKTPNVSVSNEQISHHIWQEIKSDTSLRTLIYRVKQECGEDVVHNVNGQGYMVKTV